MELWAERDHLIQGNLPSSSAIKIILSKHVFLIMRIIILVINIINIDDIGQERPSEDAIRCFNYVKILFIITIINIDDIRQEKPGGPNS